MENATDAQQFNQIFPMMYDFMLAGWDGVKIELIDQARMKKDWLNWRESKEMIIVKAVWNTLNGQNCQNYLIFNGKRRLNPN